MSDPEDPNTVCEIHFHDIVTYCGLNTDGFLGNKLTFEI